MRREAEVRQGLEEATPAALENREEPGARAGRKRRGDGLSLPGCLRRSTAMLATAELADVGFQSREGTVRAGRPGACWVATGNESKVIRTGVRLCDSS